MSALLDELAKKAQALTVEERAQFAQALLEAVERDSDPEVQAAWEAEEKERRRPVFNPAQKVLRRLRTPHGPEQ